MTVFLDTSFFYARVSPRDQWHRLAKRAADPTGRAVTSSLVVNETVSLLQARGFFSGALAFLQQIRAAPQVEIVVPDAALQTEGWDLLARYGPAGAGVVDCTSFAIMRRMRLRKAYTFDDHFTAAGFQILKR
jgi:uncharacterized protein